MAMDMEYEVKVAIEDSQYNAILTKYGISKIDARQHVNHYYDTMDHAIYESGAVLRLRTRENKNIFTLKKFIADAEFEEYSEVLYDVKPENPHLLIEQHSEVKHQLELLKIDVDSIRLLGLLTTMRFKIPFEDVIVEIDKSTYNMTFDYEIEIEGKSAAHAVEMMEKFCKENNVSSLNKSSSKYTRFIRSL